MTLTTTAAEVVEFVTTTKCLPPTNYCVHLVLGDSESGMYMYSGDIFYNNYCFYFYDFSITFYFVVRMCVCMKLYVHLYMYLHTTVHVVFNMDV